MAFTCDHQTVKISQSGDFILHECADCGIELHRKPRTQAVSTRNHRVLFRESARFLGIGAFCACAIILSAGFCTQ